jgi:trans-aconitate methyltransferase
MWDARLYDDKHSFVWKHGASLVELLAPQPGEAILDLGCGTGHLTAQIAAAGVSVLGIDSSPPMIEEAHRNHPGICFEVQDARHLETLDQFHAVFSNAALHWIIEAEPVVQGIARALKPGGRFVAEFGGKSNVRLIVAAMQKALLKIGVDSIESPWYFPSIAEYAGLLEEAGLEVTFATLFDRPTPLEGDDGMRKWVEMFGGHFLNHVPDEQREKFFRLIEDELRPALLRDGTWFADYRRIRVVAWRRPAP